MPIPNDTDHIARLLFKSLSRELEPSEQEDLNQWKALSTANAEVFEEFSSPTLWQLYLKGILDSKGKIDNLLNKAGIATTIEEVPPPVHRVNFLKTAWLRYAAAVILIFGVGAYLWTTQRKTPQDEVITNNPVAVKNDVAAPTSNRATLTLANGQTVYLDRAHNGSLALQGDVQIVKLADGQIVYNGSAGKVVYNTLTNPKGSKVISMKFSDGSTVWLNAESSIRYPTVFTGNERKVQIMGEAYFSVSKNKSRPFIVQAREENITVLGTEFNVNSYADERFVRTTLISGSVKLQNKILKPGQAHVNGEVVSANIDQTVAWKNGIFNFNHTELQEVMKQLGRWYDIEVHYEGEIPKVNYVGKVQRSLSLKDVLEVLSGMGAEFSIIDNRRLIVTKSK